MRAAFCNSVRSLTDTLRITFYVPKSDQRSGVNVSLPTLISSALPIAMPSIVTCGKGNADACRSSIETGSSSRAEKSAKQSSVRKGGLHNGREVPNDAFNADPDRRGFGWAGEAGKPVRQPGDRS